MPQVQRHGFVFENQIRTKVFNLPPHENDTNVHDIPSEESNDGMNYSVKTTSSDTIGCGDLQRFIEHRDDTITMLSIKYSQEGDTKVPKKCFELTFTDEVNKCIFGINIDEILPEINGFVTRIRNLPRGMIPIEERFWTGSNNEKEKIQKKIREGGGCLVINPKVDRANQRRVQCSIKIRDIESFIINSSVNTIRGHIIDPVESGVRVFN